MSNMVFVFGSNSLGRHGAGAAKAALKHGAVYGVGFGPQGNSFALPTCAKPTGEPGCEITPEAFKFYVDCFLLYAKQYPELDFQVTRVGCGLAGWKDEDVAPMFDLASPNCQFDSKWETILPGRKYWGTF